MKYAWMMLTVMIALAGCGGKTGTCASTCTKLIATNCPNDQKDQAACVMQCETTQSKCAAEMQADAHQSYLDCIESNDAVCGESSGTATTEDCLEEGLAILSCAI